MGNEQTTNRKRAVLKDENWRVFKINWRPPIFSVINMEAVEKAKEVYKKKKSLTSTFSLLTSKGQIGFYIYINVSPEEMERIEKSGRISEKFGKHIAKASAEKLRTWGIIDKETRVNIKDVSFHPLYIFEISGENIVASIRKIETSKDNLYKYVRGYECVRGLKVERKIFKGTYEFIVENLPKIDGILEFTDHSVPLDD